MRTQLETVRERLASTYWIIPATMVSLSIILSLTTIHVDQTALPTFLQDLAGSAWTTPTARGHSSA